MTEQWRDIKGYKGLYQVSNLGNVKALPKTIKSRQCKDGSISFSNRKEKILKPSEDKDGYYRVTLTKDGKPKYYRVNRLVAEAFVYKPEGKDVVYHIDENVKNNSADNLMWVTTKENLYASDVFGKLTKIFGKEIIVTDLHNNFIAKYASINDAAKSSHIDARHISAVVNGKRNRIKGYNFFKEEEY